MENIEFVRFAAPRDFRMRAACPIEIPRALHALIEDGVLEQGIRFFKSRS